MIYKCGCQEYDSIGFEKWKKKSYEEALQYFMKAIDVDPNIPYIHNNLGMVYAEMGMHEKARDEFEKAIADSERKASSP